MTDLGKNRFFSTLQTNGKRVINGDFMGISWDFMGFHGNFMGFHGDFMGFHGGLVGSNGDYWRFTLW
jgi:hypothetical protein